jgi:hypothetical protein
VQAAVLLALAARGPDGVEHIGFGHGELRGFEGAECALPSQGDYDR